MIDINHDGKISIYEYYMVLCLIIKSRVKVNQYFKEKGIDENDQIDKETLKKFFIWSQEKNHLKMTITLIPDPRKITLTQ